MFLHTCIKFGSRYFVCWSQSSSTVKRFLHEAIIMNIIFFVSSLLHNLYVVVSPFCFFMLVVLTQAYRRNGFCISHHTKASI